MADKATVGRIVHFYDDALANKTHKNGLNLNGQGAGPYPALVLQVFPDSPYANLLVHGWSGDWREGSVAHKDQEGRQDTRYWEWPPRA